MKALQWLAAFIVVEEERRGEERRGKKEGKRKKNRKWSAVVLIDCVNHSIELNSQHWHAKNSASTRNDMGRGPGRTKAHQKEDTASHDVEHELT